MSERFQMGFFGRLLWLVAGTGGLGMVWFGSDEPTWDFGAMFVQLASLLPMWLRQFVEGRKTGPVPRSRQIVTVILVLLTVALLGIVGVSLSGQKRRLLARLILTVLWIGSLVSETVIWQRGRKGSLTSVPQNPGQRTCDTPHGADPG